MPYRKVLVPLDYAGCADLVALEAAQLCQALGAQAQLLVVLHPPDGADPHSLDPQAALSAEARSALEGLRLHFDARGVATQVELAHGPIVEQILAAQAKIGADLILMGTHARQGLRRLVLGSVAEEVLRRSPVPVLVVPSHNSSERPSAAWSSVEAETEG